jgi:O-antigen chain-terminating methyltransferase
MSDQTGTVAALDYLAGVELNLSTTPAGHSFYSRPNTEDALVFEDVVDRNEYKLPVKFKPGDVVIDIGGHIGSFSYAAALRGAGKIFTYEPHPANYAIARKNLEQFGETISCHNLAVWRSDRAGEILYNEDISGYTATGGISLLWNERGLAVSTISLDDVLREASNDFTKRIRFLKIDCEGAEFPILFTATRLDVVDQIAGEYHEIGPEIIPARARIDHYQRFDGQALKDFFIRAGWTVTIEPKGKADGLFSAHPNQLNLLPSIPPEVNIDEVKARIRAAVAQREAEGRMEFIKASAELFELLSTQIAGISDSSVTRTPYGEELQSLDSKLNLQPDFVPHPDGHYHVNDLLKYHDSQFIWNAYRAVLQREPDEPGLNGFLQKLRSGRWNKIDVLARLRFSPEGRRKNITIDGLQPRAMFRRLYRLPVLGYVAEWVVNLVSLPKLVRNQRSVEAYLIGQQERTAAHINDLHRTLALNDSETRARLSEALEKSFSQLNSQQREFASVQHQQLSGLFRTMQLNLQIANAGEQLRTQSADRAPVTDGLDELYANFQNQLRGDFETVKASLSIYLSPLSAAGIRDGILDLGCGRGEWLELLRESGAQVRGVESNRVLAARAHARQLDVVESDALTYLNSLAANSLKAVTAFHFVEHLTVDQLIKLVSEVQRVLHPGGLFIIETPNPKNLVVGACNFYSDPTHRQPFFPETLQFLIGQLGFEDTRLSYLHAVEGSPFRAADEAARVLNSWLFSARDYSIVAIKPQAEGG